MKKKRKPLSSLQRYRRATLGLVIAFFIFVPLSNRYANFKLTYNNYRLVDLSDGPVAALEYRLFNSFYTLWEDPVRAATSSNGSLWAFSILGAPFSDPLGMLSELTHAVRLPVPYIIGGIVPFLFLLLFGRIFCAWICPMTVVFAITTRIRKFTDRYKVPFLAIEVDKRSWQAVFWLGMICSFYWGAWIWHFVLPYITFTHEIFSAIVFSSFTVGIYYLVAVVILDITVIPGQFCTRLCPSGYLLSVVGRLSILKLAANRAQCPPKCKVCLNVCPMELFPKEGDLFGCHLCMLCKDACPKKHLELKATLPLVTLGTKTTLVPSPLNTKETSS